MKESLKEKIIEILESKFETCGKCSYFLASEDDFEEVAEEIEKHFKENEAVEMFDKGYKFRKDQKKKIKLSEILIDDSKEFQQYIKNDFLKDPMKYFIKGSPENRLYKSKL